MARDPGAVGRVRTSTMIPANPARLLRRLVLWTAGLTAIVGCGGGGSSTATGPSSNPSPASLPHGIYVSGGPTTGVGEGSVTTALAQEPFVAGFLVRIAWKDLEPTEGAFAWSLLDGQLARARQYGKKVALGIVNGPGAPDWVYAKGAAGFDFLFRGTTQSRMPIPWDAVYLDAWTTIIAALGGRYGTDPTIALVHATSSTGNGFEMQLPSTPTDLAAWTAKGYTTTRVADAWARVIDAFADAFPATTLDVELHPVLASDAVATSVMTHAATRGAFAFAAWWSQTNTSVYAGPFALLQASAGRGFASVQFVTNATNDPSGFGVGGIDGAITLALDTGVRYMEIWDTDLRNAALRATFVDLATRL